MLTESKKVSLNNPRNGFNVEPIFLANNNDMFVPEIWALESINILVENMVMGNLVHRDFENEVASFGDIVHTRKPNEFEGKRKTDSDEVTVQDASSTNIPVPLDQHVHVAFMIKDGERSKSMLDLVNFYLRPALIAQARFIDRMLVGTAHQFYTNYVGKLGTMSSSTVRGYVVDTRTKMNVNKVPEENRNFIITPNTENAMLNTDLFVSAEKVGDAGTALRKASLGQKFGFEFFMAQNQPSVVYRYGNSTAITVNDASIAVGDTTITVSASHGITVGDYITFVGDGQPQLVTAVSTNDLTISPGFTVNVPANGAVVTKYIHGLVDLAGHTSADATVTAYGAGYAKEIYVDGLSASFPPVPGQLVVFGDASTISGTNAKYSIVTVSSRGSGGYIITLDRPLEVAIINNALMALGPSGEYNFAFNRGAIALINRPLAQPMVNGVISGVAEKAGISIRVVISYDPKKQGHLVVIDGLFGKAVLDTAKGCVMLG